MSPTHKFISQIRVQGDSNAMFMILHRNGVQGAYKGLGNVETVEKDGAFEFLLKLEFESGNVTILILFIVHFRKL